MGRYVEEKNEQQIAQFLGRLLEQRIPAIKCEYGADSPCGFSYPMVEEFFGLPSLEALALLEDLVTEGVLDRRLANKVHLDPETGWHTLNFIEVCPRCDDLDIEIESVVHHFACGYVGAWSEFRRGVDLVCPNCDDQLRHLGMDYERPSDTYLCSDCGYVFTDSKVVVENLRTGHKVAAEQVRARRIYDYLPNAKTSRAVEDGRIHGLDIESVLFEDQSKTFRQDFLIFEIDREIYRARRYESPLSMVLIDIEGLDQTPDVKDAVDLARVRKEIFEQVGGTLRGLDVLSAANANWAGILLPETPLSGAMTVAERLHRSISEFQSVNISEPVSTTVVVGELLEEHQTGKDFLAYVHSILSWAVENQPGTVVSADTWRTEARNA